MAKQSVDMKIDYKLLGNGWAEFVLQISDEVIEIPVSYLHDSLRELTEAALKLSKGIKQAEVSFVDEPGEHRLVIENENADQLKAEVYWYKGWPTKKQNPDESIIRFQTTIEEFRNQVLQVLRQLEQKYGAEKYLEVWINHEFPQVEFERLKTK